jgi:molybdate transport repressor ModE-like protein
MLDVRRLRVLVEIDARGSFSAAAHALSLSQPAASQHIAALERETGLPLVERGTRPVGLTEAGHVLARHARGVLARLEAAEQEVAELAGRRRGRLRLGSFPTALATLIPPVLAEFRRRRPEVSVTVVDDHMQRLRPRLAGGELDLALVYDDPAAAAPTADVETVALLDDRYCAVVPSTHRLATRRTVALRELVDETWIGGEPGSTWFQIIRRACRSVGFDPGVGLRTDDYVALQALVAAGLGVCVMPSLGVRPATFPIHACAVAAPTPTRRISIALACDSYRPPTLGIMIDIMKEAAARRTAV